MRRSRRIRTAVAVLGMLAAVAAPLFVISCGGDKNDGGTGTSTPPATQRATSSTTPGPTPMYPVEPSTTPVVWSTVVAPPAPDAGRADCPADWVAYADGENRFSICYPGTFVAQASSSSLNANSATATDEADTSMSIVASWGERPYFSLPPSKDNCALVADSLLGPTSSRAITLELAGSEVQACLNEGRVNSIQGSATVAKDGSDKYGFVRFTVNYSGPASEASAEALAVLATLRIGFR